VREELANLGVTINCETAGLTILTWSDAKYRLEGAAEVRLISEAAISGGCRQSFLLPNQPA
tara:strand:- start:233 stop:415 length:183 start_codon:yes stop_codon:yes gene_type:complete